MQGDIAGYHVRGLIHGLAGLGLDSESLLRASQIDRRALDDPETRVVETQMLALWLQAHQRYGKPTFGLDLAQQVPPGKLELVDYVAGTAGSVGAALESLAHHARLCASGFRYRFEAWANEEDPGVTVHMEHPRGVHMLPRSLVEYLWSLLILRFRDLCGAAFCPTLQLRQAPLGEPRAYRKVLGRTPVQGPDDALHIPLTQWELENPRRDPTLAALLAAHASDVHARLGREGFDDRLHTAVVEALHRGDPSLQRVSSRLGLSTRSLQRRLAGAGMSFAELVDSVRHESALRYLSSSQLSLAEISGLLAYADPSAFGRAFRRWTGTSPHSFRQQTREEPTAGWAASPKVGSA